MRARLLLAGLLLAGWTPARAQQSAPLTPHALDAAPRGRAARRRRGTACRPRARMVRRQRPPARRIGGAEDRGPAGRLGDRGAGRGRRRRGRTDRRVRRRALHAPADAHRHDGCLRDCRCRWRMATRSPGISRTARGASAAASSRSTRRMPTASNTPAFRDGVVTQQAPWKSTIFEGTTRDWWVYVPAQYTAGTPAAVMVFQDGAGVADLRPDRVRQPDRARRDAGHRRHLHRPRRLRRRPAQPQRRVRHALGSATRASCSRRSCRRSRRR